MKNRTVAKELTRAAAVMTMKTKTNTRTTTTEPIKRKLQLVFGRTIQMRKMNGMNKEALTGISTEMTKHKKKVKKLCQ